MRVSQQYFTDGEVMIREDGIFIWNDLTDAKKHFERLVVLHYYSAKGVSIFIKKVKRK